MIIFEHPCSERIRTMLRLEAIFARSLYFSQQNGVDDHFASMLSLFEMLDVTSRTDLKSELLQEFNRQRLQLPKQSINDPNNPEISSKLIQESLTLLQQTHTRFGQSLRENDWLMSIKSRTCIPGGACEFDLPSLHQWLHQDIENKKQDLNDWLATLHPPMQAIKLILQLIRNKAPFVAANTIRGAYLVTQLSQNLGLLRICVAKELNILPEISATRHAVNIRFVDIFPRTARPSQHKNDISFQLAMCHL